MPTKKIAEKMAKAANSDDLREAFEKHFGETERHVKRLEKVLATRPAERPATRFSARSIVSCPGGRALRNLALWNP